MRRRWQSSSASSRPPGTSRARKRSATSATASVRRHPSSTSRSSSLANFIIAWVILAGAAGLLFGTAAGTPLALAGVTLAALAQMAVSRGLAGEHRGKLLPPRTKRIENFLTENGAVAVMESRIVPVLPYGLVNYSAGLTHLRYKAMALGTVIGAAPKVFAYTALGGSLDDLTSPEAITAIALLVILGIAGALFVRHRLTASRPPRESPGSRPAA